MQLSDYGMSRERGFLSPYEIDEVFMPTRFDAVIDTAERLSDLLSSRRVRHWLETGQTLPAIAEAKPASSKHGKTKPVSHKHPAKRGSSRV